MKRAFILALGGLACATLSQDPSAQIFADFETVAAGSQSVFRQPSFSGSTGAFLDVAPAPNTTAVTATFPAGNPESGLQVLGVSLSFKADTTNPWLRLTTSGTADHPNPVIDLTQFLRFDIFTDRTLKVALGVKEVTTTAAIGANGGSTGGIEWTGLNATTPKIGSSPNPDRTVAANSWSTLWIDINGETSAAFSGAADGIISTANGLAVLEHLALVPADGSGTYNVYLDNFEVTPVPEPAACAGVLGLVALGGAMLRRRFAK